MPEIIQLLEAARAAIVFYDAIQWRALVNTVMNLRVP
jgi:hypothetical protein